MAARHFGHGPAVVVAGTAVAATILAAPPSAADKLCGVGPPQPLEQSLADCRRGDVVLAVFPEPASPPPSTPGPAPPPSRIAGLVARVCDLEQEVFLQPGATDDRFVLACVYTGRILGPR
jgi:hypothetical protein